MLFLFSNIGQMELRLAPVGLVYRATEKTRWLTKEKCDLLSINTPTSSCTTGHTAVHDMVRLMNNVNIIRQTCPCGKRKARISSQFLKDSKNRTHSASLKLQLGGQKTLADIWTKQQMKIGLTLPLRAKAKNNENNWKLALNAMFFKREDYLDAVKKQSRICDSKMTSQPILQSCRAAKLDRGHSKNATKNDSGSGTRGPIHPLLHQHGQDCNFGGPLQSGRTTNDFIFLYKEFRSQEMAIPL